MNHRPNKANRRGAAVVEFAMVAPVFILLVFGMIEFGRAVMVQQVLVNASREGARLAVLDGTSTQQIEDRINEYLAPSNINSAAPPIYRVNGVTVSDPTVVAGFGDAVSVRLEVNFSDVSWLPVPQYIGGTVLNATSTMRRENSRL